ncbi:gliding motility protein RemB [Cochleicola gelatinilyticus]|uniref:Gliding motility protein RemB n=1 Tax=Cochleicola gelatinilyticus TaxID=1763537 RepID=A0A167JDL5_9FLAO|nr:gliding motility protein RemB [Cochleicola gelatinilyticus]OAB80568.1 gliding motility protein RemB [Cochleicola gelatinilyticus]
MKNFPCLLFLLGSFVVFAQNPVSELEKYPVFERCSESSISDLEYCFNSTLQQFVYSNFKVPEVVSEETYSGSLTVLFEVSKEGAFKVLYVDAFYDELKDETRRVFGLLPKITPATYNGNPSFVQFTMLVSIPLVAPGTKPMVIEEVSETHSEEKKVDSLTNEYDSLEKFPYENEAYSSNINIPLSHEQYTRFDPALNRVGINNHTAQKPYIYSEVNKYYDFEAENKPLLKNKTSWFGRKLWNEHMVTLKGKDYWLTLDPGVDLQVGKDTDADISTYNNTRLAYLQGGLGKNISFFAVVYESQGSFAEYFNRTTRSLRPDGGNPGIVPGRGIAKEFKGDDFDYPVATGHISYSPSKWFNVQLGHGKNFIGDGYRSLLVSDNASPYPFFKLNTTFWKLKYTNTWMSLRDVRPEVTEDGSFRTKFIANHYLSYNVTKRLNIGLFESVIWQNDNDRGFDFNYINPVIFYRAIEFSTGSRGGNALIGLSAKYKFTDQVNAYGQLIIDEFSSVNVFNGDGSYKNKTGYQIGLKYYDAFKVKGLYLQGEYNRVRPYTYSHNTIVLNYGHNNQSLAHTLGANFSEFIAIARYNRGRVFGDLKLIFAKRGFEFNNDKDDFFYGADIYGDEDNRVRDLGNEVAQGNTTDFFHAEIEAGYLINPATNLKIYGSLIVRDFKPESFTVENFKDNTTWFNLGIRTDLFNWYYDF